MSIEWRSWCRLCANSDGICINVFENTDIVWPERIVKYLSISINDDDELPRTMCQDCCQRLTAFDRFAEECLRIQSMFQAMSKQLDDDHSSIALIHAEYIPNSSRGNLGYKYISDNKKGPQTLAIDADPFIPSDSSGHTVRKTYKLKLSCKRNSRLKATSKSLMKSTKSIVSKIEDPERRSSRLQVLAQTQIDFGIGIDNLEVKSESVNITDAEITLPRKRGRPSKRLVGAAKRKAKKPRVVKPKKISISDDDFDELGMKIKSENGIDKDKISQASIFRWECHICGEMARNWNSLSIHTRRVHEVAAQVLCLCAKVLSSRASIIKHRLKHTDGYKYKCEKCDKSFHRRGCYELHVLSHVPKEEQPFVCCKCARRFHCEALLRQHEKVHLPREERLIYPCTTCQKKFSSKSAVSAHIKSIHFGERPFVCDQCGHSFTSKGILQEHLTIHSDETPFKCQHCHKSFKTKYRLKIHLDIHRETPYQCPMCPLQLSTRRTLRMHLVVHKDTKAFQCSTCGKAFRRAKDLKNHHNLHTGRRPYTCTFCPRTFANGSNCRSHKRRMHPDELRVYEAALAAAESQANNPTNAPTQHSHIVSAIPTIPISQTKIQTLILPVQPEPCSNQPNMIVTTTSNNQQMIGSNQEFHRQVMYVESGPSTSMKDQLDGNVTNISQGSNTMMSNHQNHISDGSNLSTGTQHENSFLTNLNTVSQNNQFIPRNTHHQYNGLESVPEVTSNDCIINRSSLVNSRRMHIGVDSTVISHNLTPLNLNISELHSSNRHQMSSNLSMGDSDNRRIENFHVQRSQLPNLNLGHSQNNHQIRQHQAFGLNRGGTNLNRSDRDLTELNRDIGERDLGNSNLNQIHHNNSEHTNLVQGYSTSLNTLYRHPGSVAAAMAHSSTIGVPAFPGNPYVHHGMSSSLSNYQRGNGNM